jgi:hypothetical protein
MLARFTALVATLAVALGVGGAFAVAKQSSGGSTPSQAGALDKPGKHCGDKNHIGNVDRGNDPDETDCKGGGPKR